MSLGGTDLNLLVAMQALLEEGNVTNAGKRLELSQPAMSGALAKLRRRFDDELLTRNGREYDLTPLAQELLPQVQHAVHLMGRALGVEEEFDPASSERTFTATMSDYAIAVLHEPLLNVIAERAPHIRLRIDRMGPALRASERVLIDYDVMIGPSGYGFLGSSRVLWRDRMVCLVDRDNRRLGAGTPQLTMEDLAELPHAVGQFGVGNLTPADRAMGEHGLERRVAVEVSGWLPLPFVVEGSDMVAVVPQRLARMVTGEDSQLVMVEPPFGEVALVESYWFAPSKLDDPGACWFMSCLDEVAEQLTESKAS